MASLAQLKKRKGSLEKLQKKLADANSTGAPRDERIWKPKFNQEKGRGIAIVRFLPAPEGDEFVEVKTNSFRGPGGTYFGIARDTIKGEEDPILIAAINGFRKAKHTGDERYKTEAKQFLPRSQYYANVLVVRDDENPENNGKVMIFQFGRQIYLKLEKAITPEYDDEEQLDPFDLWEGANFKIKMSGKEIPDNKTGKMITVPTYEDSAFDNKSELFDGDEEELQKVVDQAYDLSEFVDPSKIKSFEEVADKFEKVMKKPYNWLDPDAVEQSAEKGEVNRTLDEDQADAPKGKVDNGSNDQEPPFSMDDEKESSEESVPEDDSPLARFQRMTKNK